MGVPFDPDKIAVDLSARGKAWAELDAAFKALEEVTKSVLSEIMGRQNESSEAARERAARSSPDYREHLAAVADARKLATIARVNYDVYRVWIEMKRSELSYQKAEMGIR